MADYTFDTLSPFDFESLTRDLLTLELKASLQPFTSGRDKGIDLRYSRDNNNQIVVQCKHYASSTFSQLKSNIKNVELPKIKSLRPSRYVLVTSLGLTPSNVDSLYEILTPYSRTPHDIIGRDHLNAILRQNPQVEQNHFKLWLNSSAVLQRVLHSSVFAQTSLDRQSIRTKLSLYVQSRAVDKARDILRKFHCCIVSGIPGIGKTTLAEILLIHYLMNDWEVVGIRSTLREALDVYQEDDGIKQVFFYDDFLGQTRLTSPLDKNEDKTLIQLISAITRSKSKRLIMTTREHILAQAQQDYETLSRGNFEISKFSLTLDDYSDLDKARILANHLYFYSVPEDVIREFVDSRSYLKIVHHRNYSPRIVEWMTSIRESKSRSEKKFSVAFLEALENPNQIWEHAFKNQISESSRALLLALFSIGSEVYAGDLESAFESLHRYRSQRYNYQTRSFDFQSSLKELEGAFLRIAISDSGSVISFLNPSVVDFLSKYLSDCINDVEDIVCSSVFFEQIETITDFEILSESNIFVQPVLRAVENTFLSETVRLRIFFKANGDVDYFRRELNIWKRATVLSAIAQRIDDTSLTEFVSARVNEAFEAETMNGMISRELIDCMNEAASYSGLYPFVERDWRFRVKNMVFNGAVTLDCAVSAAAWAAENRDIYSEEEWESLGASYYDKISREAIRMAEDTSDPDDIDTIQSDVWSIETGFGIDLDSVTGDLEMIKEQLTLDQPEEDYDPDGYYSRPDPTEDDAQIHSVFQALLGS